MRDLIILAIIIITGILIGLVTSFLLTGGSVEIGDFHWEFVGVIELLVRGGK